MARHEEEGDYVLVQEVTIPQLPVSRMERLGSTQIVLLMMILLGLVVVGVSSLIWPDFFKYRYAFFNAGTFFQDVFRFWPLFMWAVCLGLLGMFFGNRYTNESAEVLWMHDMMLSLGSGVLEEGWFRGVGIFFGILTLIVVNFILGMLSWVFIAVSFVGIVFAIASFFVSSTLTPSGIIGRVFGIGGAVVLIYALIAFNPDPLYLLYEHIFYPIINFTTFGMMQSVLYGAHDPLLVMGAISANFAFRDGHKYQGLFGWSNAWFGGCVFMFAMFTYGVFVAMAVHALANAIIGTSKYLGIKIFG